MNLFLSEYGGCGQGLEKMGSGVIWKWRGRPNVNSHGQYGRATANGTTTKRRGRGFQRVHSCGEIYGRWVAAARDRGSFLIPKCGVRESDYCRNRVDRQRSPGKKGRSRVLVTMRYPTTIVLVSAPRGLWGLWRGKASLRWTSECPRRPDAPRVCHRRIPQ